MHELSSVATGSPVKLVYWKLKPTFREISRINVSSSYKEILAHCSKSLVKAEIFSAIKTIDHIQLSMNK